MKNQFRFNSYLSLKLAFLILFFVQQFCVKAADENRKHYNRFALQAGNNILQNGRKMAKDAYFLKPSYYYYHDNGFYAGSYLYYMIGQRKQPIDNIALNLGYDKDFGDHLTMGIDYTFSHYFSTKQVTSSAASTVIASTSWYNGIVTPGIFGIWNIGSTTDFTLNLDLSHIFYVRSLFKDDDKLTIPVSLGAYWGTSNYLVNYSKTNTLTDKKGKPLPPTEITTGFTLTTIYLLAGVKYRLNNWALGFTATYNETVVPKINFTDTNIPVMRLTYSFYF